jgi:hypothetical protein
MVSYHPEMLKGFFYWFNFIRWTRVFSLGRILPIPGFSKRKFADFFHVSYITGLWCKSEISADPVLDFFICGQKASFLSK